MSAPLAVRAYRSALALLPPAVRARDGEEMVATFAAMWTAARGRRRLRVALASFGRVPLVALADWLDALGGGLPADAAVRTARHAVRSLVRAPAFSASTILLLGVGIGAVTTMYTLVDHVLLRPLPYPDAGRLFMVDNGSFSGPDWRSFQSMPSVEAWAAVQNVDVILTGEGEPLRLLEERITPRFFEVTGARPELGRFFGPDDFAKGDVVLLSSGAWRRIFGADPSVLGRSVHIDGVSATVVGVVEAGFVAPSALVFGVPDVWRPQTFADPIFLDRGYHVLAVMGRFRAGATLGDVARDAAAVAEARAQEDEHYKERDGTVIGLPVLDLLDATVGRVREGLNLLLGAVGLLLLVACANVAHLFMARAIGRARELAVRRALGAGRRAIAAQLMCESLVVALAGGALGVALAAAGVRIFLALSPRAVPRADAVHLDARVLAFALVVSAATAAAFGLLGLRVGRAPADGLREGGRTASSARGTRALRSGLVIAEVALSLVLVAQAGLLLESFARLHAEPLGFRVADVWSVPLQIPEEKSGAAAAMRMEAIREALASTPGVRAVSFSLSAPMEFTGGRHCCWNRPVRGGDGEVVARMHPVGAQYFDVFEQRVLAGRVWSPTEDGASPAPAVVNDVLATQLFGSIAAAVGSTLEVGPTLHQITGVVAGDRHYGPGLDIEPSAYVPMLAVPFAPTQAHMVVRTDGAARDLPQRLRAAVWRADPEVPVPTVVPMSELVANATASNRFDSALFGAFGVIALVLAAGGLYGTLLYVVSTERREMGIRLALGAARGRIQAAVLARGLRLAAAGAALGTAGAWAASRLLRAKLYQVEPGDPGTLAAAVGVLLLTAAVSCWLPARRAASTDPVETLRLE